MDELTRLAHASRLGDRDAFESLVEASYSEVWRFCAALVDEGAADDLAQDTYLRAVRAVKRFRGDASARTWLLAIARRACADEIRSRARRRDRDARLLALDPPDGSASVADPSRDVAVSDLLARLDPERRIAFVLTQFLRLSYEDAAAVCGCPPGTIRSRVARARDDLVRLLAAADGPSATGQRPARGSPPASV